nr:hypothetical protein [Tanacetum cinerariifolium]
MDSNAAHIIAASKDIIKNGNSIPKTQTVNNVETFIPPTTADEKLQKRNEVKARIWRNKPDLETLSMDDLYNNLKIYKSEVKGISSSTNTQNMAFVSSSSNNSNISNGVNTAQGVNIANGVNTASSKVNAASLLNIDNLSDVVIYAFLASQPNSTQPVNEDLEQIHPDDLEEMDLTEDRLKLKKLMELCTKMSDRVLDLEKTKTAQAKDIANLKKKFKKLERKRMLRTPGMNLFKIGDMLLLEEILKEGRLHEKIPACCDDDDDYDSAITPVLSTEEPVNSLSMGDEHLDTILATKSDEFIKSYVETLVPDPRIDKTDCHPENEIRLSQRLLYDKSSPRPDSFMEEIDLFLTPDDPMPPSIEDDEDSEGDILFLERLLHDDPIPLPDTLDFSYEVRIFLPFFTYLVTSPVLLSFGNEDTIFDPGITINHFYSLKPGSSHQHGAF